MKQRKIFLYLFFSTIFYSIESNAVCAGSFHGSGSSVVEAYLDAVIAAYRKIFPSGGAFSYKALFGSSLGMAELFNRTTLFAASDVPHTDQQQVLQPDRLLSIPIAGEGIAIAWHIDGYADHLKLTAQNLADIFSGQITRWNNPQLVVNNPSLASFDIPIFPITRLDGSGSTNNFTTFLASSQLLTPWPAHVTGNGPFTVTEWGDGRFIPNMIQENGSQAVANFVRDLNGAIGYVGFGFVVDTALPRAYVQNKSGHFINPTTPSIRAAIASNPVPLDVRIRTINSPAPYAYPIASPVNIIIFQKQPNECIKNNLVNFLKFVVNYGQELTHKFHLSSLPGNIRDQVIQNIELLILSEE